MQTFQQNGPHLADCSSVACTKIETQPHTAVSMICCVAAGDQHLMLNAPP